MAVQGQSPFYYCLLWLWTAIGGFSPESLRVISLFAFLGSGAVICHLSVRLFPKANRALLPLFFLTSWRVLKIATDARPYMLGMFFALLATLLLVDLLRQGTRKRALWYGIALSLAIHCHFFLIWLFPIHAFYCGIILYRMPLERVRGNFHCLALSSAVCFVGLMPLYSQVIGIKDRARNLGFLSYPSASDVWKAVLPPDLMLLIAVLASIVVYHLCSAKKWNAGNGHAWSMLVFSSFWVMVPPLGAALVSYVLGQSVFVHR